MHGGDDAQEHQLFDPLKAITEDDLTPKAFAGRKMDVTKLPTSALLLLILAFMPLAGCVSTPKGSKFDPVEGVKRLDESLDTTINRLQDRSYN
ncbi:MAG: hypothetical protein D4R65_05470 [Verrucomicrobiaceae bacterium]|nr:MAG: hypothetical protein D4R65_05470 [Verrucomicrobiaceae bacterium]